MQKPHFVAQGAALSKVMEVSIVVLAVRCAAPCLSVAARQGFLAPRRRRARVRPLLACVGCCVTETASAETLRAAARTWLWYCDKRVEAPRRVSCGAQAPFGCRFLLINFSS